MQEMASEITPTKYLYISTRSIKVINANTPEITIITENSWNSIPVTAKICRQLICFVTSRYINNKTENTSAIVIYVEPIVKRYIMLLDKDSPRMAIKKARNLFLLP